MLANLICPKGPHKHILRRRDDYFDEDDDHEGGHVCLDGKWFGNNQVHEIRGNWAVWFFVVEFLPFECFFTEFLLTMIPSFKAVVMLSCCIPASVEAVSSIGQMEN